MVVHTTVSHYLGGLGIQEQHHYVVRAWVHVVMVLHEIMSQKVNKTIKPNQTGKKNWKQTNKKLKPYNIYTNVIIKEYYFI